MKKFKYPVFLLCFGLILHGFYADVSGQKISQKGEPVNFRQTALINEHLQFELEWDFGKKPQKGWFLYVPLIKKTLETSAEPDSAEFAREIRKWQKRHKKLNASGILDSPTLFSLIDFWQSKRIKPIRLAADRELFTAPIADFYDPTRAPELLKVEKAAYAAYKKMIRAAAKDKTLELKLDTDGNLSGDEKFLKLISTYRSPEYQAGLRKKEPNASRAQIAFVSPHFTGRALDIYVGGEPVTTKDPNRAVQIKTPAYLWLVENAEKFGFYPYFYEPWHWEFVPGKEKN